MLLVKTADTTKMLPALQGKTTKILAAKNSQYQLLNTNNSTIAKVGHYLRDTAVLSHSNNKQQAVDKPNPKNPTPAVTAKIAMGSIGMIN